MDFTDVSNFSGFSFQNRHSWQQDGPTGRYRLPDKTVLLTLVRLSMLSWRTERRGG